MIRHSFILALAVLSALPGASAAKAPNQEAPRRLILQFKPEAAREAEDALSPSSADLSRAPRHAPSLGALWGERRIRRMSPAFPDVVRRKRRSGLDMSQRAEEVRRRFQRRARRTRGAGPVPDLSRAYVLDMEGSSEEELLAAMKSLRRDPGVESVHRSVRCTTQLAPNDPFFSSSGAWGQAHKDLYGVHITSCPAAWDVSSGAGVVVAVIDTGLDRSHPDINDNVWSNPDEVPGNGKDDDGNGFVDDAWGWDFTDNDNNPADGHGHGTHVSGTIAAEGNNRAGIIGVAPKAKIMTVKGLDDDGDGGDVELANSLVYAAENGADVINMSWGGEGDSPVIENAVAYAESLGVTLVAAAGNNDEDTDSFLPAKYAQVIAVAAFDAYDRKADFSNFGRKIEVAAPGVDVLSLRAAGTDMGHPLNSSYTRASGTSMAAPHTAGLAALVLSQHPAYSPRQVRLVLRRSADDLGMPGRDPESGFGRINALRALRETEPRPETAPPTVAIQPPASDAAAQGIWVLQGTASDESGVEEVDYQVDGGTPTKTSGTSSWMARLDTFDLTNGPHTVTVRALDEFGNRGAASLNFVVLNPPPATYDQEFKAPRCAAESGVCHTGALINGRGSVRDGAEPRQPNTLRGSCADGNQGLHHFDESIDQLRIYPLDGTAFSPGKSVRVEAKVWVYSRDTDQLDLYYTADARAPRWVFLKTITPTDEGAQVLSSTYTLPQGGLQAIRGRFRFFGAASPCGFGEYDDHDDLVFAVQQDSTPPSVALTAPAVNAELFGVVSVSAEAADDIGVAGVRFKLDGINIGGEVTAPPYAIPWDTGLVSTGTHVLTAVARDRSGQTTVSSGRTVTVTRFGPVRINFQPASAAAPEGYRVDAGLAFTDQGGGLSYGWNADNTASARDRNASRSPDQRYDTFNILRGGGDAAWELAVPPGTYSVRLVAGDPEGSGGMHGIRVEGAPVNGPGQWLDRTVETSVSDGRLTLSAAEGSSDEKLCFVEISATGAFGSALPHGDLPDIGQSVTVHAAEGGLFTAPGHNGHQGRLTARLASGEGMAEVRFQRLDPAEGSLLKTGETGTAGAQALYACEVTAPGRPGGALTRPAVLSLPYLDADQDGTVDSAPIQESALKIFWHDGLGWRLAGGTVDAGKNTVTAQVPRLAVFGLFAAGAIPTEAKAEEMFLTPALADGINDVAVFGPEAEEVDIYDINGSPRFSASQKGSGGSVLSWPCRDDSGRLVESGPYIARVRHRDGSTVYQTLTVAK